MNPFLGGGNRGEKRNAMKEGVGKGDRRRVSSAEVKLISQQIAEPMQKAASASNPFPENFSGLLHDDIPIPTLFL